MLGEYTYHKQPEWMVFKPETFRLPEILCGIHTFTIETDFGYQVSGFQFERLHREFAENCAADAERIYGDKFTVEGREVTGIGNNVVLEFGEFDFSEEQPAYIVITGRSALPLNSIHLMLDSGERVLCEFRTEGAEDYVERSFGLSGISGKRKISFTFLPGSDFDFRSFRFGK